ncbi:MAG: DMT family transporter [Pseudomonadota bacterium]
MAGERAAIFAGLFSGLSFGLFWIPIRALEEAGFAGPWAMVVLAGLPLLLCLPLIWRFRAVYATAGAFSLSGGFIGGIAFALYATAFIYTDIVRVIVLFYAMPAWGFLLGWLVLKDPITPARILTLILCFTGLFVVFGRDTGLPLPENLGDWCALLSGMVWAGSSLLILMNHPKVSFAVHGVNFFASATVACLIVALLLTAQGGLPQPTLGQFEDVLIWVVPVTILLTMPACFATVFAPTRLNPGVAGLLFMAEVVVGAASAALLAGEVLGLREIAGLVLMMTAGLMEPAMMVIRGEKQT